MCLFVYYIYGFNAWIHYIDFGNFNGKVNKKISFDSRKYFNLENRNKLILLDFYNTSCVVCFRKFPVLQDIYTSFEGDTNILIYSIDIPLPRDTPGMAINLIRSKNYTFPVIVDKYRLDSVFQIYTYPTTILLKDNTMILKGDIEKVKEIIKKELK